MQSKKMMQNSKQFMTKLSTSSIGSGKLIQESLVKINIVDHCE